MKKLIVVLFVMVTFIVTPITILATDETPEIPEGCKLVETEKGEWTIVCENENDNGIAPCQIKCTLDCWDDE